MEVTAANGSPSPVEGADPVAPAPRPGDGYVQSFARGLAVLRSFGEEAPQQTLSAAAARTGMTRAGARRILLTLRELGYVSLEGRHFRLTPKVLELGFAYLGSQPVWRLAQPALESLSRGVRAASSAAVLDGEEIVYVLHVPFGSPLSAVQRVGSRQPAGCTAMGRVLLGGLAPAERRQRIARMTLEPRTPLTITDRGRLLVEIEQASTQGQALVAGEAEQDLVSLAVPIVDRAGRILAAIDVSTDDAAAAAEGLRSRMLSPLLDTAASINALMRLQE